MKDPTRRYVNAAFVALLFAWGAVACSPIGPPEVFIAGRHAEFNTLAFSPDGKTLASSGSPPDIKLWDLANSSADPLILKGHQGLLVGTLEFSPDGELLASGGTDGTIRIWDLGNPELNPAVIDHGSRVRSLAFSPDGKMLASIDFFSLRLWSVTDPQRDPIILLEDNEDNGTLRDLDFSPDGQKLAACGNDGITLWNPTELENDPITLTTQEFHLSIACEFSPDGRMLASSGLGTIVLWDVYNPTANPTILGRHPDGTIWTLAFSPNGRVVAAVSQGHQLGPDKFALWNVANLKARPIVIRGDRPINVVFSPDGNILAGGGPDRIRFWDVGEIFNGETR